MIAVSFDVLGDDRFRLAGRLGFDTVDVIWDSCRKRLDAATAPVVDLGEVTHVDSAGLALLLELVGAASAAGKHLRLLRVPPKLMDLARISEVSDLLGAAVSPPATPAG